MLQQRLYFCKRGRCRLHPTLIGSVDFEIVSIGTVEAKKAEAYK